MELIKKHYQKIIAYGLIILGIIAFFLVLIIKPPKIVLQDVHDYTGSPSLSNVSFPLNYEVKIASDNAIFIQLLFGDDSINLYDYNVTVTNKDQVVFEHLYDNETSNIIRLPLDEAIPNQGDTLSITIDCKEDCKDVKMELYDIDGQKIPRLLEGYQKRDLGFFWYSAFLIAVGLTLLPLAKERKK